MMRLPAPQRPFRRDIDGLRAIAVAAVMLYHFGIPGFGGGFAGVDVFFVISGYLMTRMIFPQVEAGRCSLVAFYLARARRIVPALTVLCLAVTAVGWFTLLPEDYLTLGTHVISASSFVSHIFFGRESGYFDVAPIDKWRLHTWSLSVEWQFYFLYPVAAMLALPRVSRRTAGYLVLAACGASPVLAVSHHAKRAIAPSCMLAGGTGSTFLWGDSHAQALSLGLKALVGADHLSQVATSGCPPGRDGRTRSPIANNCALSKRYALAEIARLHPETVVMAQRDGQIETDWNELARTHAAGVQHVIVVGPAPAWRPALPALVARKRWFDTITCCPPAWCIDTAAAAPAPGNGRRNNETSLPRRL